MQPLIGFLFIEPWFCLGLPSDFTSRCAPSPLASRLVLPRLQWIFATRLLGQCRFEWDKWNAGHLEERHGLSPEVEEVFGDRPVVCRVMGGRLAAYGQTDDGRYLTVIFHLKPGGVARVVTARDMNEWVRHYYRQRRQN